MPKRVQYPHMYGAEALIWTEFEYEHGKEYDRFEYDVHVGKLWPELEEMPEPWRKGAEALYLKRIDAIGFQPRKITIFEVKPHAGLGALGQIIGYLSLYEEQFEPKEDLAAACVTRLLDPNIKKVFEEYGIDFYIYPELPAE